MINKYLILMVSAVLFFSCTQKEDLTGTWALDDGCELKDVYKESTGGQEINLVLTFDQQSMEIKANMTIKNSGFMQLEMVYTVPGSYTKKGNTVECIFDRSKADFRVEDIKPLNQGAEELFSTPGMKDELLCQMDSVIKADGYMEGASVLYMFFQEFQVSSITESKLVTSKNKIPMIFHRIK